MAKTGNAQRFKLDIIEKTHTNNFGVIKEPILPANFADTLKYNS